MRPTPTAIPDTRQRRLRVLNVAAGALHVAQAVAVVALATDFALPVTASYLAGPPGTTPQEPTLLFDLPTGLAVAGFLALSALAHLVVTTAWWRGYVDDLSRGINRARWVEYSLSSSLMMVVIAQLVGIADVTALLAIVGVNASMILFGWLQERYEQPGGGGWLPFWFGCIAGAVPWLAVVLYTIAPQSPSEASPPGFVYAIIVSLFVFFNIFALNQWLQYRARGRWADYLFGETVYIVLSLVAKSLLAWQVFGGTLNPGSALDAGEQRGEVEARDVALRREGHVAARQDVLDVAQDGADQAERVGEPLGGDVGDDTTPDRLLHHVEGRLHLGDAEPGLEALLGHRVGVAGHRLEPAVLEGGDDHVEELGQALARELLPGVLVVRRMRPAQPLERLVQHVGTMLHQELLDRHHVLFPRRGDTSHRSTRGRAPDGRLTRSRAT